MTVAPRSGFRIGDWVEVRSLAEVLATLDGQFALEGLPFMPEMASYCGRRFQVARSAHKTCDPTGATDMRRMRNAVYLDIRCDGGAHDGCQARCRIFWKTAWLKKVDGPGEKKAAAPAGDGEAIARLAAAGRYATDQGLRYRCQATEIVRATERLSPGNLRQYVEDIKFGNVGAAALAWNVIVALAKGLAGRMQRLVGGNPVPTSLPACSPIAAATHRSGGLGLHPGEFVKVKSASEILSTLEARRGPAFETEMFRHCGHTHRILYRVNRIIDERCGKMIRLSGDCVVLEGVTCAGLDNRARLFCPRSCYYFWREAWLTRVAPAEAEAQPSDHFSFIPWRSTSVIGSRK